MSVTRRVVLVALVVVVGFVVFHSVTPWGWTGQLRTPPGAASEKASYTCGALWGSAYVHGPHQTRYPLEGTPCGERRSYQVMTGVDVLLGVFVLAAVVGWRRVPAPSLR